MYILFVCFSLWYTLLFWWLLWSCDLWELDFQNCKNKAIDVPVTTIMSYIKRSLHSIQSIPPEKTSLSTMQKVHTVGWHGPLPLVVFAGTPPGILVISIGNQGLRVLLWQYALGECSVQWDRRTYYFYKRWKHCFNLTITLLHNTA